MTPKEKAKELVFKFETIERSEKWVAELSDSEAKQCALIAVDELILYIPKVDKFDGSMFSSEYWFEVQEEIKKL